MNTVSLCLLLGAGTGVFGADIPSDDYPDSAAVRMQIADSWLGAELDPLSAFPSADYTDRYVQTFTVSQKKYPVAGLIAITVAPVVPAGMQGTWILFRRLTDGMPDHIRLYPEKDSDRYISLRPDGSDPARGKTLLDFHLYGAFVCRDIPVGLPFLKMYTTSFSSIVRMTSNTVPWNLLTPDIPRYRDLVDASQTIRERLGTLVYLDDGAFNEKGEPVHILDGSPQDPKAVLLAMTPGQKPETIAGGVNCSGFGKWIVDGIIKPRAGTGLYINPLKTATASPDNHFTEPWREKRDLFFALDWTRNLASAVVSLETGRTVKPDASGVDVMVEPFAGSTSYKKNVGYRAEEILPLLYWLAVKESGTFYLGAVSNERGDPILRQFHHIAAFFPYFENDGTFKVAVFESAAETPIDTFIRRNTGSFIHLVRIRAPESCCFQP